jgi:phosphoribosyl 1,2-cyclic phosphodiesterase
MPGFNPQITPSDAFSEQRSRHPLSQFSVKFWGVRGSIPTPGHETVRYGGNTACVEIQVGGKRLIFDGGTGLRALGKHLMTQMPVEAHLFFTHTHWDRIQGFPFFMPAFVPGNCFRIYGAVGPNGASIKQRLSEQMLRPNFPVPLQAMQSELKFSNISPGSVISLDDVVIETISLNRSNSALGYRVTWEGHSVVYATDTESRADSVEQSLLYLAQQADVLIFDATYADNHYYVPEMGSQVEQVALWRNALEAAIAVEVKQIIIFHHDPAHEDSYLDQLEQQLQADFPNVAIAKEGMVLEIDTAANF